MTAQILMANVIPQPTGGGGATVSLTAVGALTIAGSAGTFGTCNAVTTGSTATGWVWSVISQVGGTFTISAGQGTATASAAVSGVSGASATGLLQCVVTTGAGVFTVTTALSFTNSTVVSVSQEAVPAKTGVTGSATMNASAITVVGGTPSSFVWSIINPLGGTWSISGGAGTSVAGAQVSGVAAQTTATATLQCVTTVNATPYTTSAAMSYQNTANGANMSVEVTPLSRVATSATSTVTSGAFDAAITGGVAPYVVVWESTANDGGMPLGNFFAVTSTALTTTTRAIGMDASDGTIVANFQVTITDSLGAVAVGSCSVAFETSYSP